MKILLIGAGKWGQNYIPLLQKYNINIIKGKRDNWKHLLSSNLDGVIVATPPDSHISIANEVLQHNIPVLIEKPLALSYQEAYLLKNYQNHNNTPILINNIHLFSSGFQRLAIFGKTAKINKIISCGTSKNTVRNYSTLFDWGSHLIAMGQYIFNTTPKIQSVNKKQINGNGTQWEIVLDYNGVEHHLMVCDKYGIKKMNFAIECQDGTKILYDDMTEGKFFINGVDIGITQEIGYMQPLENVVKCFLKSINGYKDDRFGVDLSLETVKIIEQCENYLK